MTDFLLHHVHEYQYYWIEQFFNAEKKFETPGAYPHFTPDHEVTPSHLTLEFWFNLEDETATTIATFTLQVHGSEVHEIRLDAKKIDVHSVQVNGREVDFTNTGTHLLVSLKEPARKGETLTMQIKSSIKHPDAGLYFIKPDSAYPDKQPQVWTQCQDEDASFIFPCFDHPSYKQSTETIIHVPKGWFALGNGDLVNKEENDDETVYHYKLDVPHSTYLITIAAGVFTELKDKWEDIDIYYYVPPDRVEDGKRSFSKTPKILQFFSEYTGVKYPYSRYSQIAVSNFIFGGMENTTATTQTDLTLHDERAHLDFSSDGLVAHEAAHQWFGDYVTCKEWTHAWLNEGFATYFDALFREHDLGKDEFLYQMLLNLEAYIQEDSTKYRRPIVTNVYEEPIDMFDRHLYPGGAWRLHMLRNIIGDQQFREVLKYYLNQHKLGVVETIDLQRAFEVITGKNLDWFFDQFIYKPGYPSLEFSYSWDNENNLLKTTITQSHVKNDKDHVFRLPLKIAVYQKGKDPVIFSIDLKEKQQSFYFPLPSKPHFVALDPDFTVLKSLTLQTSQNFLLAQLTDHPNPIGRIDAVNALTKNPTVKIIETLGKQLRDENEFWGVRARIAKALGKINGPLARSELLQSIDIKHPKARRAVVTALGAFEDENVATALIALLDKGDPSYYVEASAVESLGKTKDKRAYDVIVKQLSKDSHNDVIRSAVFTALGILKDERGLSLAIEWSQYGKPELVRRYAIQAIGSLGKIYDKEKAIQALKSLSKDKDFFARYFTIMALKTIASPSGIPILQEMHEREADGRLKRNAYEAIQSIQKQLEKPKEIKEIKDELEKLKKENTELRDRVLKLESKTEAETKE